MTRASRCALAVLALACLCTGIVTGAALAKPGKGRKPSPQAVIKEAFNRHNAAVGDQYQFVLQMNQDIRECEEQAAQPPEAQLWGGVEADGQALQLIVSKDLRPYGKLLPGWIATIEAVKVSGHSKAAKAKESYKQEALAKLREAQSGHGREFFAIDGLGNQLILHNCGEAQENRKQAGEAGDPAWLSEGEGLNAARELLGLHGLRVSPLAPYATAGNN